MSGVITQLRLDRTEKLIVAESMQDVEPIIEHNKKLQGERQKSDWGRHVASIPNIFLNKWLNEEHARGNTGLRLFSEDFNKIVQKKINDPEYRFLRVDK